MRAAAVNPFDWRMMRGSPWVLRLLCLRAPIRPGRDVAVNGASGGVGTSAVQIAKAFGAEVTAVCAGRNAEMVRSIDADRVIDHTHEDFTRGERRYDLIFDGVANHSPADYRRILKPTGTCLTVGAR